MRASDLHMEDLVQFLPQEGKILLKGSRVIVLNVTALGKIRKDLVDTLGIDMAKGILLRFGRFCGIEAATGIKEQIPWDNDLEWINAGPAMHALTGHTLVQPNVMNINRKKGKWLLKGDWLNSFEAEQHVQHFGYHHEPVCWLLVGYGGGFASTYLGKTVIYKEVSCVGKGDKCCTFVGKSIEDWGDEINSELIYYENMISKDLVSPHHRINTQNHNINTQNQYLEQIVTIHGQLTQCILNGKGLEEITTSLAETMKCTAIFEDYKFVPQFTCFPEQSMTRELLPYLAMLTSPSFKKDLSFYMKQKHSFQLVDHYANTLIYRLVSPILINGELLGFISLLRSDQSFSKFEHISLEQAASVFAIQIFEEKKTLDIERRLKGDFFEDLLSGNFSDGYSIVNRAQRMGYDITIPHRVLVFEIQNFNELVNPFGQGEKQILQFKTGLINKLQSNLDPLGKGIVFIKNQNIIVLLQQRLDSSEVVARTISEEIIKLVSHQFPRAKLSVGIGSLCTELLGFHNSFLSAQKAIEIGKTLKRKGEIISLEQFGALSLLFSAINPTDLYQFATDKIGQLIKYDEMYKTQLIPTLQEFLNHCGNIENTAKSINISASGLKYRLQRIKEITGQDPRDSEACLNLHLAIKIFQLVGEDITRS